MNPNLLDIFGDCVLRNVSVERNDLGAIFLTFCEINDHVGFVFGLNWLFDILCYFLDSTTFIHYILVIPASFISIEWAYIGFRVEMFSNA